MTLSRKITFSVAGLILLMLAAWMLFAPAAEPIYQGRPLSTWLIEYEDYRVVVSGTFPSPEVMARQRACREALRQVGTNAHPWLVKYVAYQPPGWFRSKSPVGQALRKIKPLRMSVANKQRRQGGAVEAFQMLGTNAAGAIPELGRVIARLRTNDDPSAVSALVNIGPPALPALCAALTNRQIQVRAAVAQALGRMGTNAFPALPALLQAVEDPDSLIATRAMSSLGSLHFEPDLVISSITAQLSNPNSEVRYYAARALGDYGPRASNAVPALVKLLNDPNPSITYMARRSLTNIDLGAYLRAHSP